MTDSHTLTVQSRRPADDFWMVWDADGIVGSVRSWGELEDLLGARGLQREHVRWEDGAREQLDAVDAVPPHRTDT
jgi:hypothetical protein